MLVCGTCGTELTCLKNGIKCHFGNGYVYGADLWQCNHCGLTVAKTAPAGHTIPADKFKMDPMDIEMREGRCDGTT